jgi:hypothetical protein
MCIAAKCRRVRYADKLCALHLADRVFAKRVRSRGICEGEAERKVACNGELQCAHIIRRRYFALRWDEANALSLCAAHHLYWTHHQLEWEAWIDANHDPDYQTLRFCALRDPKQIPEDVLEQPWAAELMESA